jgi:hypothetical protein
LQADRTGELKMNLQKLRDCLFWVCTLCLVVSVTSAFAQAAAPTTGATIDFTQLLIQIVSGVFGLLGIYLTYFVTSHIKDQKAAATISEQLTNSLGAIQHATQTGIATLDPRITVPVSPQMGAGVQHMLDTAGDEMSRLGITQAGIVSQINARLGLANIEHNKAITGGASTAQPTPTSAV